jgi:radical SAM protein with 4Fe4S-binding SPASM domain
MRTGPDYIQLYPTLRCNRSCGFCFNRSVPFVPDLSLDAFRAMLDVFNRAAVKTLDIMGGEPTLHAGIVQLVHEAMTAGLSVNISSNGSNLSVLEEILGMGKSVTVGISINDRKTLEQVRGFVQAHAPGVKSLFGLDMDSELIHDILLLKPKRFYLIYRDALAGREVHATVPFYQYKSTVEQNFDSEQVGMVYCSGFVPDTGNYPELSRVRCPAGTTKLGVLPDGSVYPCNLFFGKREFLLGNIMRDSFASIWSHRALAFFRSAPANACPRKSCALHEQCHGGCPAQALVLSGDLAAPDPRCSSIARRGFSEEGLSHHASARPGRGGKTPFKS